MGQPVVHFEIGAKNAKKLQSFYASQFGWKVDANNPMNYGVVNTGAKGKMRGINGGIYPLQDGSPQTPLVYVQVTSIDAALKQIEKAGGKTVLPRTPIPGMVTFAQFADPEGNIVGLVEAAIPPKAGAKKASKAKKANQKASKKAAPPKKAGKAGKKAKRSAGKR
jgi:hypothetical protein